VTGRFLTGAALVRTVLANTALTVAVSSDAILAGSLRLSACEITCYAVRGHSTIEPGKHFLPKRLRSGIGEPASDPSL